MDDLDKIVFKSVAAVPMANWRWPNFTPEELKCKGTGKVMVNVAALDKLQALRDLLGVPLHITSAYRSKWHNDDLRRRGHKTAKKSRHLKAIAFDVQMHNHDPAEFEAAAREVGFTRFGFYVKNGFMHIDTGKVKAGKSGEWGKRWPNHSPQPANTNAAPPVKRKRQLPRA